MSFTSFQNQPTSFLPSFLLFVRTPVIILCSSFTVHSTARSLSMFLVCIALCFIFLLFSRSRSRSGNSNSTTPFIYMYLLLQPSQACNSSNHSLTRSLTRAKIINRKKREKKKPPAFITDEVGRWGGWIRKRRWEKKSKKHALRERERAL